jgi:hypothetical protein
MSHRQEIAMSGLLDKLYVANVKGRLRELEKPKLNDMKRWPFELLQNARDSITGGQQASGRRVHVVVMAAEDQLVFQHDGEPFTQKSRLGLLFQNCEGKEGAESVGRFGTGFMTTHCVSKVVTIESDMWSDDEKSELCGFRVTMYRNGMTDEELIAEQGRMRSEEEWFATPFLSTRFIYHLQTEQHRNAMRLGIDTFKRNAPLVLLFCPEIESVEVMEGDNRFSWFSLGSMQVLGQGVGVYETKCEMRLNGMAQEMVRFVHVSTKEPDAELSRRYRCPRELRLTLAVQVDSHDNIVRPPHGQVSCFIVFPLIGFEDFILPVYLNSPDFEPTAEREELELSGRLERDGIITDVGVNQRILERSAGLFEKLVGYLAKNCHQLDVLAQGLRGAPSGLRCFDEQWFRTKVMGPYQRVLEQFHI